MFKVINQKKAELIVNQLKLQPVTNMRLFQNNIPSQGGLYDPKIFGKLNLENVYIGYIKLESPVLIPVMVHLFERFMPDVFDIIFDKQFYDILTKQKTKQPTETSISGYAFIDEGHIFEYLKHKNSTSTIVQKLIAKILSERYDMLYTNIILVPATAIRPYQNANDLLVPDEITQCYSNILRAAELLTFNKSDTKFQNQIRKEITSTLQALFNIYITKIGSKDGIIRRSLLGKRADFSTRAVITVNPNLKPYQIGVPFRSAVRIFQPWLIHYATTDQEFLERFKIKPQNLKTFFDDIYKNKVLTNDELDYLIKFIQSVVNRKKLTVIAKRDPALHRSSLQAFEPLIVTTDTIQISPMVCTPYNADFDGDQMAIYVPLTKDGQESAKALLPYNQLTSAAFPYQIQFMPEKDFIMGLYYITKDVIDEHKGTFDLFEDYQKIIDLCKQGFYSYKCKVLGSELTLGRALINILAKYHPTQKIFDSVVTKQTFQAYLEEIGTNLPNLSEIQRRNFLDDLYMIQNIGRYFISTMGKPHDLSDFMLPDELKSKKEQIDTKNVTSLLQLNEYFDSMLKDLKQLKSDTSLYDMITSGSRGNWQNVLQTTIGKGLVTDVHGNVLDEPIINSLTDGLTENEFFNASYGARKGIIDRAMNTANSGYLTRKLVYSLSDLKYTDKICTPLKLVELVLTPDLAPRLYLRNIRTEKGDIQLTKDNINQFINQKISLYSPLTCRAGENVICARCYGGLYHYHKSKNIGIIAAQSIGERTSQLIMKTFHTGGQAQISNLKKTIQSDINLCIPHLAKYFNIDNLPVIKVQNELTIHTASFDMDNDNLITKEIFIEVNENEKGYLFSTYQIIIPIENLVKLTQSYAIVKLLPNTELTVKITSSDMSVLANDAVRIFDMYLDFAEYLTPLQIVMKLASIYADTKLPLIHFEVAVTNMAYSSHDYTTPYRLTDFSKRPVYIGAKKLPFKHSAFLGIAFEDVGYGIASGMFNDAEIDIDLLKII